MNVATAFALILVCIAAYCGISWVTTFLELRRARKHHAFSDVDFEFYNDSMFKLGLCGIISLGFAGAIIA